jgi:hypothetical protein
LASTVPLTPALLRLEPMFDPLRNDPRSKRLVAGRKSSDSLYDPKIATMQADASAYDPKAMRLDSSERAAIETARCDR